MSEKMEVHFNDDENINEKHQNKKIYIWPIDFNV